MKIELCQFKEGENVEWDDFVLRSPNSGYSHLSGWRRVVGNSYQHETRYLWAHDQGKIRGIFPAVLIRSLLFGRSLVSMPFLDEGGICALDSEVEASLYKAALGQTEEAGVGSLVMRNARQVGIPLPFDQSKVAMTLELSGDPDQMFKGFGAKVRNQIRKAQRSGLRVDWNGPEAIPDFYRVFTKNMRDLGSPVHSCKFFNSIFKEFGENVKLVMVRREGKVVGGGIWLKFKDSIYMPWASSLREYFPMCPNNLLYWEVIRTACEQGMKVFDFGRSSPGSGTFNFKKQWGAVPQPLFWQVYDREGKGSTMVQAEDPKFRWVVKSWKRLPLFLANRVGPILRRQMSN